MELGLRGGSDGVAGVPAPVNGDPSCPEHQCGRHKSPNDDCNQTQSIKPTRRPTHTNRLLLRNARKSFKVKCIRCVQPLPVPQPRGDAVV